MRCTPTVEAVGLLPTSNDCALLEARENVRLVPPGDKAPVPWLPLQALPMLPSTS